MPYVDKEFYTNEYQGAPLDDEAEFPRLSQRASDIIDQLTSYRIKTLEDWPEFIQTQVKKAVCAQIEFYQLKGGYEEVESGEDYSNFAIGSFSYSKGGASSNKQADRVSPSVVTYLRPTGLLYTGIGAHG